MKWLFCSLLLTLISLLLPLACAIGYDQQNTGISAHVAENIFSYVKGNDLVIETNFERPLIVSVSNGKDIRQYIGTKQKLQVPIATGDAVTITEAL
jgi:hypothetical protein